MSSSHRSTDIRSGLVIDTRDLGRGAGTMKEIRTSAEAPEDFGTEVIAVPSGSPISLDLRIEAVVEGVLVTGTASATAQGECVRCLEPVRTEVEVDLAELFVHPTRWDHRHAGEKGPADEEDEEVSRLDGDLLDLEPVLRDQMVLDLPFQPLCREDCLGLCAECGARLNDDPEHEHRTTDPRWGSLADWQPVPADPHDR